MSEPTGLLAHKKEWPRHSISDAAVSLFLERGFDRASVNHVAAAAVISKPTLYRHSQGSPCAAPVCGPPGEAARVVRDRRCGIKPVAAPHRHFQASLDRYDPVAGLNDHPEVVAFHRLAFTTPSLAGRLSRNQLEDEQALTDTLGEGIHARRRAAQALAAQRVLARANWQMAPEGTVFSLLGPKGAAVEAPLLVSHYAGWCAVGAFAFRPSIRYETRRFRLEASGGFRF
ncbi:helix-turn-helix domain-containing protein [Streptomyces sp. NPDC005480]|uniref:helix-turn-helix domain-containing protein n=1 Tax=Streptomyces sp. NPDC005480 TaxID=3154880 RepID=UPI0033AB5BD3